MKKDIFIILTVTLCSLISRADQEKQTQYERLYQQLMQLQADPSQVATLDKVVLQRDVASFTLEHGRFYLCKPIEGRVRAGIFMGKGKFTFSPPTEIEKKQLSRFYEKETLREGFQFLFVIFADSTLEELKMKASFAASNVPSPVDDEIRDCLRYMGDPDKTSFDSEIMKSLLDGHRHNLFYSHIGTEKSNPVFFIIDPFAEEEIIFMRRSERRRPWSHMREIINQFHKTQDYNVRDEKRNESLRSITIENYTIESSLTKRTFSVNLDFQAVAKVTFRSLMNNQHSIYFDLYNDLVVDSALWDNNERATIFRGKENEELWIDCLVPLAAGEKKAITVYYRGDLVEQNELGWYSIKSSSNWYPRHGGTDKARFDLTFRTPAKLTFVSVGDRVSSTTDDDVTISHWVTSRPIRNASFNIGLFKSFSMEDSGLPPVTALMSGAGHDEIARALARNLVLSGREMEKEVGTDIVNSISFFQNLYGPSPVERFYATEIPGGHGEAFSGLIHLAWVTFQRTDEKGYDEIFRAHEVAHQWWGIGVEPKTYHDRWLSEGFSDYSGLWYMQAVLQDNDKFFNRLREWKEAILSNRHYLFGSGQEAGPIWLGHRTHSSSTERDYDLIIYKKGAWVLHMLRNMLIDLKTMNEDRFKAILREFYSTYVNQRASTEDFQRVLEKHLGIDMAWFFKQWVYDTKIPEYEFAYKVEQLPDGKYKARCRVKQLNVGDDFQMYVPILISFGKNGLARVRALVKGPVSEFDLPVLPLKPEKIVFNDLESVLCEVDTESW